MTTVAPGLITIAADVKNKLPVQPWQLGVGVFVIFVILLIVVFRFKRD